MQDTIKKHPEEDDIDLLEYWRVLWRRKKMILALFIVSVLATMIISLLLPKYYKSETVIITSASDSGGLGAALSAIPLAGALAGAAGIQSPADKVMVFLKSRTVTEMVIRKFDLLRTFNEDAWDEAKGAWKDPDKPPLMEDLVKSFNKGIAKLASNKKDGTISISIEWKDPRLAADIANYYVIALTGYMNEKSINMNIQVVDRAIPAERKSKPKVAMNMALAGVLSGFISIFLAFFLDYLDKQKRVP